MEGRKLRVRKGGGGEGKNKREEKGEQVYVSSTLFLLHFLQLVTHTYLTTRY
jgi:hypothetical protein